jgi:hypothetical protein
MIVNQVHNRLGKRFKKQVLDRGDQFDFAFGNRLIGEDTAMKMTIEFRILSKGPQEST